ILTGTACTSRSPSGSPRSSRGSLTRRPVGFRSPSDRVPVRLAPRVRASRYVRPRARPNDSSDGRRSSRIVVGGFGAGDLVQAVGIGVQALLLAVSLYFARETVRESRESRRQEAERFERELLAEREARREEEENVRRA